MLFILTGPGPAVHQLGVVAVVVGEVEEEVVLALLVDGAASDTEEVAGAVPGVGEVGRGRPGWGTVNSLLALTRHWAQAL